MRRILLILSGIVLAVTLVVGGGAGWIYSRADVSTVGRVEFTREMSVPPLASSVVEADGTRVFQLDMRSGTREFRAGQATETWGFNGDYLGPTLRARRGEQVRVQVRNGLKEASTAHWHGMHLPAAMDGGPHQMVQPGATWTPEWRVDQAAATLWYHPHPHGATESHVRRGLAGMFIINDDASDAQALPHNYGVDDVPVMVQDVKFKGGQFDTGRGTFTDIGVLGDRTMVNGVLAPYKTVGDELVRLRLLNASTARIYNFGFSDDRRFTLIGTDGGLLAQPESLGNVQLSPGERAEIVVRFQPGERVTLRSDHVDLGLDFLGQRFGGGDDRFDLLEFRAAQTLRPSPALPATLVADQLPNVADSVRERDFSLTFGKINDRAMAMDRIDATVTRGSTETWVVRNADGTPHNFHVHDVRFAVVEVDGHAPPPALRGPKDTVFVPPGGVVKLALRFDGPADPNAPYMFHCHLLWHEDMGMMGQFVVVEPGQQAGQPPAHEHAGH
ncbi:multicopper oxidase domain-containing protein [Nocardia sp. SYP-A9097]|uniref:multicopper oxidase family protein n=1 Tax=Nocardia sp. SYP-A9097 TaxID=2663237 RepID=UPI00129AD3D3|nr:multicopper oxidase domain-containing protein [Nocardia sp. SYP-A9097]MRH89836.1 multicopper oxidase domain-containing protein [Nocardia sp. SYP-A9097]